MNLFSKLFSKKQVENSTSTNDLQEQPIRRCRQCNAPFDLDYTGGLCLDCWQKEYSLKKSFYSSYTVRLGNELHNCGIEVFGESTEGLLEFGEPVCKVTECDGIDTIPLPEDERALFTISCRNSVFAFPYNGIGLRYLSIAHEDCEWARKTGSNESIMSLCSDGRELYYLTQQGIIQSSSPEWKPKTLFDPIQECRALCQSISGDQIQKRLQENLQNSRSSQWGIISVGDLFIFYDAKRKVFFQGVLDDNIFHYHDVDYFVVEKEQLLAQHIYLDLFDIYKTVQANAIPCFAFIDGLPVDSTVKEYVPEKPEAFKKTFLPW